MKQSVPTNKAGPSRAQQASKEPAQRSGMSLAEWLDAASTSNAAASDQSPLAALAERLDRLNRTSAAAVRDNTPDAMELSAALLDRLRQAEERTATIFETLLRRNEDTEARTAAVIETIAKVTRDTETKTANALSAVAQWIESAERSPKIAVTEAMERRTTAMIETVSQRLDQIEAKLPRLDETVAKPFRTAIERLEERLDALSGQNNALKDLPAAFSRTAADLDRKLAEVASRLDNVKADAEATRSNDANQADHVARIEEKLAGILTSLATKRPNESDDDAFDDDGSEVSPSSRTRVADLSAKLDSMEASRLAMAAALEARFDRLDTPKMTAPDAAIAELRRDIADIARAVAEASPNRAIESLERQIVALAAKIDASRDMGVSEAVLAPLEGLLSDLARKVQEVKPAGLDALQNELRGLAVRLDKAVERGIDPAAFEALGQRVAAIHNMVGNLGRPEVLGNLAMHVESLIGGMDRLRGTERDLAMIARIARDVTDIRGIIEKPAASEGIAHIESRLEALAAKIERLAAQPATAGLDSVTAAFADLRDRVDQALEAPREKESIAPLEAMIARLAERLDAAQKPGSGDGAFDALERQMARIAERLETPSSDGKGLSAIERQLSDLFKQLDQTRVSAEEAAKRAVTDTLDTTVRRELVDLKSAQDTADRRTQQALEAVHKTLEKVVDRLADIDLESASRPRAVASAVDPILEAAQAPRSPAQPVVARPQPAMPAATMAPLAARVSDQPTAPEPKATEPPKPAAARQPLMPDLPHDFPIEPGAGALARSAPEAPAAEAPRPAAPAPSAPVASPQPAAASQPAAAQAAAPVQNLDPRAAFIAAARRAAQAAAAEVAAQSPKGKPAPAKAAPAAPTPNAAKKPAAAKSAADTAKAELEARVRALAATETETATAEGPKGIASRVSTLAYQPLNGIRQLYKKRRRSILIGLAALVLALGSIQVVKIGMTQFKRGQAVQPAVESTEPAPAAPRQESRNETAAPAPVALAMPTATSNATAGTDAAKPAAPAPVETVAAATPPAEPKRPAAAPAQPSVPSLAMAMTAATTAPGDVTGSIDPARATVLPESLEAAVNAGQPRAMFDLAARLSDAKGKARDLEGAAILYRKAAEAGFAPAQYRLGSMFEKGLGVARDPKAALQWYEKAANSGNIKAMHNMAVLYAEGAVTGKPDYANAAMWFEAAAEHGLRDSQYNIAILTARGLGVATSLEGAYRWLSLAAAQGDADAAKKRDDIASKLGADALVRLKAAVLDFEPKSAPLLANEETLPAVRWDKAAKEGA